MNEENPDLEEAYWSGYRAYMDGKMANDNPFRTDEDEEAFHEAWQAGWSAACWDD